MQHGERPRPRYTKASALRDEWTADREAQRPLLDQQIEAAFDGVALGNGISLHQARSLDNCASNEEIAAARALDPEERWQDVTDEKLDRLSDTLPFMDAEGFRFYLPRFMLFALMHCSGGKYAGSWACDAAINSIGLHDTAGRYSSMTQEQREAIFAFAEFVSDAP